MGMIKADGFLGKKQFLANAHSITKAYTFDMNADYVTTDKYGKKVVVAGTPVPSNDDKCVGLAFEDYSLEYDNFNGAVVYDGIVNEAQLPVTLTDDCKKALKNVVFQ